MVLAHKDHLPKEARFTAVMESAVIMTSCPNIHVVKLLDVGRIMPTNSTPCESGFSVANGAL